MTELARRPEAAITAPPVAPVRSISNPAAGTMRLVEWAEEAQAASHLARALCRTAFAGSWKGDEDGATAAILKGSEIGLTPVTALGAFDNIQGTPAPKAITLRALVQSHGHDLEIIEESDERAVARYRRNGKGDWQTTEFTSAHAAAMNLLGKDNWKKQKSAMLVARVTSKAARLVASDVILGIGYSAEELRDSEWLQPSATVERPPASNAQRMAAVLGTAPAADTDASPATDPGEEMTQRTRGRMFALFGDQGITDRDAQIAGITRVIGREITSRSDITEAEGRRVITVLEERMERPFGDQGGEPA